MWKIHIITRREMMIFQTKKQKLPISWCRVFHISWVKWAKPIGFKDFSER